MYASNLSALLPSFKDSLTEAEKSPATIEKYLRDVRRFLCYAQGKPITRQLLLDYKAAIAGEYAVSSANSMLASLNVFFRFVGREEMCVRQFKVQRQAYLPEDKLLTRTEYERLVQTAQKLGNERLQLILQTICATGIRVSELTHITVEALRQGEAIVRCKGKVRTILLITELRTLLLQYARQRGIEAGPVFVTRSGQPVSRTVIWREMKALCQQSGVAPGKVFPHNLRHLFARTFYNAGKDIVQLADVLGHTSINTTRIYTATTFTEHRRRMEGMHLLVCCTKKAANNATFRMIT